MSTGASADDDHIAVSFATLDDLYDRAEPVVLSWKGEAREVFVGKLDEWDRSAQDLQAAQKWLHAYVTTGHANYAAAHRAVLRGWGAA